MSVKGCLEILAPSIYICSLNVAVVDFFQLLLYILKFLDPSYQSRSYETSLVCLFKTLPLSLTLSILFLSIPRPFFFF